MMSWIARKVLGAAARAGEQVLDIDQRLVLPPQFLASAAPQSAQSFTWLYGNFFRTELEGPAVKPAISPGRFSEQ